MARSRNMAFEDLGDLRRTGGQGRWTLVSLLTKGKTEAYRRPGHRRGAFRRAARNELSSTCSRKEVGLLYPPLDKAPGQS